MSDDPGPDARERALNLLGIALRGGRLEVGTVSVKEGARRGTIAVAVLAADAGENARDRVVPQLEAAGVPVAEAADRRALGAALGRERVVVVGVTDRGLAREVLETLSKDVDEADEIGDEADET